MQRTPADPRLLTDAEVASYEQHGFVLAPNLLDEEELALLRDAAAEVHAGRLRDVDPAVVEKIGWKPGVEDPIRVNDYAALISPMLRSLLEKRSISESAARLMGTTEVRLFQSGIIYKEPFRPGEPPTTIGWHTDRAYWRTCTSDRMLTAWIPLQDTRREVGTLEMLDGSHRWDSPEVDTLRLAKTFRDLDTDEQLARLAAAGVEPHPVPVCLAAGGVSFHSCRVFHGSGPNLSEVPRIALTLHLQDGANRYVHTVNDDGERQTHSNDSLCRRDANGDPDYTDPVICPILLDAPDAGAP